MSIESIRNSGSVYQGSSPVQGTIRESSAVTTEGLQTSADEMQQENASFSFLTDNPVKSVFLI